MDYVVKVNFPVEFYLYEDNLSFKNSNNIEWKISIFVAWICQPLFYLIAEVWWSSWLWRLLYTQKVSGSIPGRIIPNFWFHKKHFCIIFQNARDDESKNDWMFFFYSFWLLKVQIDVWNLIGQCWKPLQQLSWKWYCMLVICRN